MNLSPRKQKQKTLEALVAWLLEEAEKMAVYCVWQDLHWADPSTLEFLGLCIDQVATVWMLTLLIFRPEFTPPWSTRSYLSQLISEPVRTHPGGGIGRVVSTKIKLDGSSARHVGRSFRCLALSVVLSMILGIDSAGVVRVP